MKTIKRILCLALAVLMLFSVVACTGGNKQKGTTAKPGETTEPENRYDDLPDDLDFGGKEIKLLSIVQTANVNSFAAERSGDVIDNAVYDRNVNLEKRLNCVINVEERTYGNDDVMYTEMQNLAGNPTYHILAHACYKMVKLAVEGMLVDLASQEFVDLDKDYYDDGYNSALNAGGRQYLVTGKMTIAWYRYQIVTLFNRNLFKKANIDLSSPYQTVIDQKWDVAEMQRIANMLYIDLDEDGYYTEADQYGYFVFVGSSSSQTDGFMSAFDLRLVEKDENGYYQLYEGYDSTTWDTAINDYLDLLGAVGTYQSNSVGNQAVAKKFTAEEAGMINYRMYVVEEDAMVTLSRKKEGYGILPLPKASVEQPDYVSYVQDQVIVFGITATWSGEDLVMCGQFLEAFASESYNTTMPAYYEKALTKKYVYDEPSKKMIEIIDSNIVVDPVNVYYGSYFNFHTGTLRTAYDLNGTNKPVNTILASAIGGGAFQERIDKLNASLKELDATLKAQGK